MHWLTSAGERNGRARLLFGTILQRYELFAQWDAEDWAAVIAALPVQRGLAFPITFAFRSENELLLHCLGFSVRYAPWPERRAEAQFLRAAEALLSGRGRMVRQLNARGRPWRIVLEEATPEGDWRRLGMNLHPLALPLLGGARTEIVRNTARAPLTLAWTRESGRASNG